MHYSQFYKLYVYRKYQNFHTSNSQAAFFKSWDFKSKAQLGFPKEIFVEQNSRKLMNEIGSFSFEIFAKFSFHFRAKYKNRNFSISHQKNCIFAKKTRCWKKGRKFQRILRKFRTNFANILSEFRTNISNKYRENILTKFYQKRLNEHLETLSPT